MKKVSEIARNLVPKWEPCALCVNGWYGHEAEPGNFFGVKMKRCHCWKAWQAKVAEALQSQKVKP